MSTNECYFFVVRYVGVFFLLQVLQFRITVQQCEEFLACDSVQLAACCWSGSFRSP